jgi:hypothetical protein
LRRSQKSNPKGLWIYLDIFKNLALTATITVLSDISTTPKAGDRRMLQEALPGFPGYAAAVLDMDLERTAPLNPPENQHRDLTVSSTHA